MGVTNYGKVEMDEVTAIATADVANSANADSTLAAPTVAEYNTLVALVNELKGKLNEICKG